MFRVSISQKFIAYLIGISFVPLLVVGILSSRISAGILQNEASLYTTEIISNQKDYLDLLLNQIENLIANLSGFEDIRVALENKGETSAFESLNTRAQIGYILNSYSNIDGLVSIDIFTVAGAYYNVGDTLNTSNIRNDVKDRLFEQALSGEEFVTWVGVEDNVNGNSSHRKVITAARILYSFNRDKLEQEPIALILANYNIDILHEHFNSIHPGENAYMLVLDSQSRFIYHPSPDMEGETAGEDVLKILASEERTSIANVDGIKMSVSVTYSDVSNWAIMSLVPVATLNAKASPIRESLILIVLVCFIAVAIMAWFYNRGVVYPIREITNQYQMIKQNTLSPQNYHVPVRGNDEIADLRRWFNTFIDILVTKEQDEEILRENLKITSILYESSNQIINIQNLPTLLQQIAKNFVKAINADRVSLILFDTEAEQIEHFYSAGAGIDKIRAINFEELYEGLSGWVLKNEQTALSPKGEPDPRETAIVQQRRIETDCGSIMVVPLKYRGKIYGTATAINRPEDDDFSKKDVAVMMAIANQAIIAIENARLVESLKESEEKFFKAFHASPDPMTIRSLEDGKYLDVNDSFLSISGYSRDELIGTAISELDFWVDKESEKQFARKLSKNNKVRNFEATFRNKSGQLLVALLSTEALEVGGEASVLSVIKDITELKQLEQERIQFTLERERIQILSDFITQASHEFRTPLSIINTNSYLLKKMVDSKQHNKLDTIRNQVHAITSLVDSLSLMAKIDSGGQDFEYQSFDINSMVSSLHDTLKEEIQTKSIVSTVELSDTALVFNGDEDFLRLAVKNYLDNAIQFTQESGNISLRTIHENNRAIIEIQDTGIGISQSELSHIFKRFYQVDKAGTMRGFGLGLPITKAIIEHYGGQVAIESVIGEGSTFKIYLPILAQ